MVKERSTNLMTLTLRPLVAAWLACLALVTWAQGEVYTDKIVAVVNGDVILESDVQKFKQPFMRGLTNLNLGIVPAGKWPTERELLDELIVIHLLDQVAQKKGLKLDEKAVEASIDSLKNRNKLSHERFVLFLAANGLNYGDFRDLWKRQLRLKGLIAREVSAKVPVSEEDAQRYFKENRGKIADRIRELQDQSAPSPPPPEEFRPDVPTHEEVHLGGRLRLRMLTIKIPARGDKAALQKVKSKAEKISQELLTGAAFADVAKKYSEDPLASKGGDLGYMSYKDMVPQWQKMVQRMKVGQVIGPIQSKEAVLFFFLDDAKDRVTKEVSIPENVRKRLIEQQKKMYEQRMAERAERQPQMQSRRQGPDEDTPGSRSSDSQAANSKSQERDVSGILTPEEEREYRKVRDQVMMILKTTKINERMKDWIEELKKSSIIEVRL
jgi:peptidyl-prolyl cis-trans isomerase SurA